MSTDRLAREDIDNTTADLEDTSYISTPSPPPLDEQTVNMFLLNLLMAITAETVPFHTRWSARRNSLLFKGKVQYSARTDGHLRSKHDQIYGLIEVKPHGRIDNPIGIRLQESAQIAAYISQSGIKEHNPDNDCRYFLL